MNFCFQILWLIGFRDRDRRSSIINFLWRFILCNFIIIIFLFLCVNFCSRFNTYFVVFPFHYRILKKTVDLVTIWEWNDCKILTKERVLIFDLTNYTGVSSTCIWLNLYWICCASSLVQITKWMHNFVIKHFELAWISSVVSTSYQALNRIWREI